MVAGRIGGLENGYVISTVLLLVVALESHISRISYLQSKRPCGGSPRDRGMSVPDYLATLRKSFGLQKSLTEAFAPRDAIAYGHVWELEVSEHLTHGQILRGAILLPGYGDGKYKVALNPRTRRSSICGFNLVPSAVGAREVHKVLTLVWRTLEFLATNKLIEMIERAAFHYRGRFQGRIFDAWELLSVLKNSLRERRCPAYCLQQSLMPSG